MQDHITKGQGLLLFGTVGTGKDHLLSALARRAILFRGQYAVQHVSGADLECLARDAMRDTGEARANIRDLKAARILILSDPCPGGSPTEFQLSSLLGLLDRRYNDRLTTWVSLNATGREQMEQLMGPRVVERIRDGAIAVEMNWPSYRRALA